jgi:hypothetical protein
MVIDSKKNEKMEGLCDGCLVCFSKHFLGKIQ